MPLSSPTLSSSLPRKLPRHLPLSFLALALGLNSLPAHASEAPEASKAGLQGHISLLLMGESQRSRLDSEGPALLDIGPSEPAAKRKLRLRPMFELRYRLAADAGELHAGSEVGGLADGFHLSLGYRARLGDGSRLGLAWQPSLPKREVWQDPYARGEMRQRSHESLAGWRLELQQMFGSPFGIRFSSANRRIATELSGSQGYDEAQRQLLRRSGRVSELSLLHSLALSPSQTLSWQLDARRDSAEGAAMAHRRLGGELRYQQQWGRQSLALGLAWHQQVHRKASPLGGTRDPARSDRVAAISVMSLHGAPFGLRKFTAFSRLSWQQRAASLDFYDERQLSFALGLRLEL